MPSKRSTNFPAPYVAMDSMDPTEQVDGVFYTSKKAFRAKGRELGLTEVGDQNLKRPPKRYTPSTKAERRAALEKAIAQHKQGRRPGQRG